QCREDECGLGVDWSEAEERCWRCGYKSSLQKCHIVPDSLGGAARPSNLVLLCCRCHREAPNVADPRFMWSVFIVIPLLPTRGRHATPNANAGRFGDSGVGHPAGESGTKDGNGCDDDQALVDLRLAAIVKSCGDQRVAAYELRKPWGDTGTVKCPRM